uniref:monoamine oxidase n=1 Tax=Fusarium oxysporum (strain Fo5176) TaxID=660025 RepID=A0A0D2XU79_FUSOF
MSLKKTAEGHEYEVGDGISHGLPCDGAITPASNMAQGASKTFDAIIIGRQVLLLEGRDRIGGRTWTSNVDGHLYEMGGTWVHWEQPHVYREMARYNLHRDFVVTSDATDQPRSVSVDDDGELHQLTLETFICILKGLIEGIVGHQDFANVGFFDVLRWWALSGYTTAGLYDFTEVYKIKQGQTHFSLQFFKECLASQRLSYVFKARVASVSDKNGSVTATLSDGRQFRGHRLISTLPLNVLREVKFDPPLSTARDEAARIGQVHNGAKIHFKIGASETRPLSTLRYSKSRIVSTLGDGRTESNGCRHMVAFGRNDASLSTVDDARSFYSEAREAFPNMPVEKVLWHDWSRDEFAKGGWCMYRPDFAFRYLEALRKREGNVLFANADWALGWRGFIDGAIEEGTRVAFEVKNELAASLVTKAHL